MAIRIERSGSRTVVSQTRRVLRIAAWLSVALAIVGAVLSIREESAAHEADQVAVRCSRASGVCEVSRGDGTSYMMRIQSLTGASIDSDGSGDAARVSGSIQRRDGLPTYWLCEARARDPEAAGIRQSIGELAAFIADRRVASLEVECRTRRANSGTAAVAGRIVGPIIGMVIILFALLVFLVEIRTEIDRDAGLVRVRGRSALPRRRWSLERALTEVDGVMVQRRGWGSSRMWAVTIHFTDRTSAFVLFPATGSTTKIDRWVADLREALGLPAPPASA